MLTRFSDFDSSFSVFDELRRRLDHAWSDFDEGADRPYALTSATAWPRLQMFDVGESLLVQADLPGLAETDVKITLNDGVLSIEGERKVDAPEGYAIHRRERGAYKFARSFTLPCKVDPDRTNASVQNGILTVTLAKAPEAQPRQIAIKSSSN